MSAYFHEWLNVVVRWAHVTAAIMWIGDSFLFMWMDATLERPGSGRPGTATGELWLTHSGGFYELVKHRTPPANMGRLWWFRWQSYSTWITGILLVTIVYVLGGRAMLLDAASPLSQGAAIGIVYGTLAAVLLVYELLVRIPGLRGARLGVVAAPLVAAATWGLTRLILPRAAFVLVGAAIGTIMTANVFLVIVPGQQRMMRALAGGGAADPRDGARAKERSTHNHFLTLPVLFAMLSNHFPAFYGAPHAWAVLPLLFVAGALVKHVMLRPGRVAVVSGLGAAACLAGVVALTRPPGPSPAVRALAAHAVVEDRDARLIAQTRCMTCHSSRPTNPAFPAPPNGVTFENIEQMRAYADRIVYRVVETRSMPLGNLTGITDEERSTLGAWAWQQRHPR